jgi:hypothetical protein
MRGRRRSEAGETGRGEFMGRSGSSPGCSSRLWLESPGQAGSTAGTLGHPEPT